MQPIADCNLRVFLDTDPLPPTSLSLLRTFFGCLASALRYLHENQVRHKDIKPEVSVVSSLSVCGCIMTSTCVEYTGEGT
jgi:serine/threonine protein kinase